MLTQKDVDELAVLIAMRDKAKASEDFFAARDGLRKWLDQNANRILATCREALRKKSNHE